MSVDADILTDDPTVLKAMIAALQAENARMSATLQAHEQLVQALRLRIARLQKQAFGQKGWLKWVMKFGRDLYEIQKEILLPNLDQAVMPGQVSDSHMTVADCG